MKKLELKQVLPYLIHDLKGHASDIDYIDKLTFENVRFIISEQKALLILRPLTDIGKYIDINGTSIKPVNILYTLNKGYDQSPWDELVKKVMNKDLVLQCPYWVLEYLFSIHIDVFGLIDKGLAIDKNTL